MNAVLRPHRCLGRVLFASTLALGCGTFISASDGFQDRPPKGKIRVAVVANLERAAPGRVTTLADAEDSAAALRKRVKGREWLELADRPEQADLIVTITGRRNDSDKGFVLGYILEAGTYSVAGEYSFAGGIEITGGARALGSDGRTANEGRRVLSWDEQAKEFAGSLEGFAKANYDRILSQAKRH